MTTEGLVPVTGTYAVTVSLPFRVSAAKAQLVLERWWAFKERRKCYMRARRAGRLRAKDAARVA